MSILHKLRYVLLMALLLPLHACGAPFWYKAEPIEAWVADAETNQPLEGVIVVAHWQLKGGLEGGNPVGEMMVMETLTDAKGRFYFPGWGPKLRSLEGRLKTKSPGILLFKSGYEYRGLENKLNNKSLRGDLDNPLRSDWNGKTIRLERFKGQGEEYARHLGSLSLSWAYTGNECEWKRIHRMVLASHEQAMVFKKQGIVTSLYTIENLIPYEGYPDKCSAREYFRERRP